MLDLTNFDSLYFNYVFNIEFSSHIWHYFLFYLLMIFE